MIKNKYLYILLIIFFFQSNVQANTNVAYMDFNYIINNSIIGKKILNDLNNLNKKNIENLKIEQNKLKKEMEEINKIKNISSKEEVNKKVIIHNKNIKIYDNLKKRLSTDLNKRRKDELNKLVKLINPLLENYMKQNSIDIILNKEIIYFAQEKFDISKDILELTNNKYK